VAEILFVENSRSRRGRSTAARLDIALARLAREREIRRVGVAELEGESPPSDRVIACGGDGTVNAVVTWLWLRGREIPIGIVPAGTGNNLAAGLGLPRKAVDALAVAVESSRTVAIDAVSYRAVGEVRRECDDGRPLESRRLFIQSAALGFPADVARRFGALRERRAFRALNRVLGPGTYALLALDGVMRARWREWRGEPPLEARVEIGTTLHETRTLAIFLGNEPTLGGGFLPCPKAVVDDGKVDLCIVEAGAGLPYLSLLRRVSRGTHIDLQRGVRYLQSPGPLTIRFSRSTPFLADGDLWARSDAWEIEVLPQAVSLIVSDEDELAGERKGSP